jgi:hypothetical protein
MPFAWATAWAEFARGWFTGGYCCQNGKNMAHAAAACGLADYDIGQCAVENFVALGSVGFEMVCKPGDICG